MKILHVVSGCNPLTGGVIEGIKQITNLYKKKNIKFNIVSCDNPNEKFLKDKSLKNVIPLGPKYFKFSYTKKLLPWLLNNISKYNLIIVDGLWQYHNYAVWKAAKINKKPYFVFSHGMLDKWFNRTYPFKFLKKNFFWWIIQYKVLRDAKRVLFTTKNEVLNAKKSFWPYQLKSKIVGYGIEGYKNKNLIKTNSFFKKYPSLKNKNIILFLGRIVEKKGLDLLINAFNKIKEKNDYIVIAGRGNESYKLKIKKLIKRENLQNYVLWTGNLEGKIKWDAFRSAKLFCLSSHQENFGISVVEALSCEIPVLISNKVDIYKEIKKHEAGFVDDDTISGTTRSLKKWKKLSRNKYKEMCINASICFKNEFEISNTVNNILRLI